MSLYSPAAPRRVPRQTRGQQRVFELLNAASEVLAEKGYEAATMSEIAERANAAIGSLYQFFPNKESIAAALNTRCCEDIEKLWRPLISGSEHTDVEEGLTALIEASVRYIETHPVVIALQQTPKSTWNNVARLRLEEMIAAFLLKNKPDLTQAEVSVYASVCLGLIKACTHQYLETPKLRRKRLVSEYKTLLRCYAQTQIKTN